MKKLLLVLFVLLGTRAFANDPNPLIPSGMAEVGVPLPMEAPITQLSNVTQTVSTIGSPLDLNSNAGFQLSVIPTGPNVLTQVTVFWSNDNSNWTPGVTKNQGNYPILKVARYAYLQSSGDRYSKLTAKTCLLDYDVTGAVPTPTYLPTPTGGYASQATQNTALTPVAAILTAMATPNTFTSQRSTVTDSGSNSAPVSSLPQENLTAWNVYTLASNAVTVVNITTTVGTSCPTGASWWLGSASAAIYWFFGNLSVTPSTAQLAQGHQLSSAMIPVVAPYPAYAGAKLYMCGQTGASTVSVFTGEFKIK